MALLVSAAAFAVYSWPLVRHVTEGIPSSNANTEIGNVRAMIPGDHLQFLYHQWLAMDTFLGRTPWFHNPYEFNTGNDADRRAVSTYYLPFSLFYTVGAILGGRAFGWNLSILVAFWLAYLFAWRLARRYQPDEFIAGLLALFAVTLPYPWISVLGGSPTGFSMMWIPILLYGLDRWVADKSAVGAALAGAAIFFSGWSDTHVFFFSVVIAPPWCLVVYLARRGWIWPRRADGLDWIRSAWPLLIFCAGIGLMALNVKAGLGTTNVAGGRSAREVALYSQPLSSLMRLNPQGDHRKMYVGVYGLLLLGAAFVAGVVRLVRDRRDQRAWALVALVTGMTGIFFLATGMKNPLGPRFWMRFVKLVPPYALLRQPDKIFCLVPSLLSVIGALALPAAFRWRKPAARFGVAALLLPLVWDYSRRFNATICLLDREQGAYRAVAEDATARGVEARALVLPLWPGDSHYTANYQHYVSLYRIRMINGYRPSVRQDYREQIFDRLQSMNLGFAAADQLDDLLARGVRYLLLHEDVFPEKVSSFPVGATLANLLRHPRLEHLAHDGAVWSFRIHEQPVVPSEPDALRAVPVLFPVRYWDWERGGHPESAAQPDDTAIGRRFLRLDATGARTATTSNLQATSGWTLEWHVRARGAGAAVFQARVQGQVVPTRLDISSADWAWYRLPSPPVAGPSLTSLSAAWVEGALDLDAALLTATGWPAWAPGDTLTIPATAFFRAGHTVPTLDGVRLRPQYDPGGEIFYSRNLYLEPGGYDIVLDFETSAPLGTSLGRWRARFHREDLSDVAVPVRAGTPAVVHYLQPDSRFFRLGFDYNRQADMIIRNVRITRVGEP